MTNNDMSQVDNALDQELRDSITEHLQVKDANGEHVGTVDHLDGDRIKLTRTDSSDGQHHYINLSDVKSADQVAVYLEKAKADLKMQTE
ncbi:DUF2171 domain-containing protein [Deinococcus psychrotolerans]|uniref:DUF2171 domain-containing protein n=2 Tax=Deinococcus TaxID=1298 RepID=A0A3G8YDM5_9DEIO|nr:DUF2171 domain-containing protein [Deinococcus psychrotolerans]AZI43458.1 DUF2171 domain-containing protein [Deinococcus psychrotolerans]